MIEKIQPTGDATTCLLTRFQLGMMSVEILMSTAREPAASPPERKQRSLSSSNGGGSVGRETTLHDRQNRLIYR